MCELSKNGRQFRNHSGPDRATDRWFAPAVNSAGCRRICCCFSIVSLNLSDPNGNHVSYDLQTNTLSNQSSDAFVSVTGNVSKCVVMPLATKFYNLSVANAPVTARGGEFLAIVGGQYAADDAADRSIRSGQIRFRVRADHQLCGSAQLASIFRSASGSFIECERSSECPVDGGSKRSRQLRTRN